jgi:hypothetical protein
VQVPWLVSYVETLLVQTWYPMTVATNSFHHKLKEIHGLELLHQCTSTFLLVTSTTGGSEV